MPHVKWNVSDTSCVTNQKDLSGLESATNSKLVAVLKQLACVVYVANRVFGDICEECRDLNNRTERLRGRLENCSVLVRSLNAKTVPVPVANLTRVREIKQHFKTHYGKDTNLFMPETRPKYLEKFYNQAAATTQVIIQPDSTYCSDTETCLTSYSDTVSKNSNADVDSRRPSSCYSKRELKTRDAVQIDDLSYFSEDESCSRSALKEKPWLSQNEEMNINVPNYPSSVVPIDVSGSNFQKMSTFRRSLIHFDFLVKRKKKKKNRRNIVVIKRDCNNAENVSSGNKAISAPNRTRSPSRKSEDCSVKLISEKVSQKNGVTNKKENGENSTLPNSRKTDSVARGTSSRVEKTAGSRKAGFLPISTFSAAMSVAVNLRGNSLATKPTDSGQSANGTSGTDKYRFTHTNSSSKSSLGKDSSVSENRPSDRSQDGTLTGYTSDSSATTNTTAPMCRHRSTSAGHSEGSFSDSSCDHLHVSVINGLRQPSSCNGQSVDVRRETSAGPQDECQNPLPSPCYETDSSASFGSVKSYSSCTSVSTIGNNSVNSVLSQTGTERSSDSNSLLSASKIPPLPPHRSSSRTSNDYPKNDNLIESKQKQVAPAIVNKTFTNNHYDQKNLYHVVHCKEIGPLEEKESNRSQHFNDSCCQTSYSYCTSSNHSHQNEIYRSCQPVASNIGKPPLKTFFPLKEVPKRISSKPVAVTSDIQVLESDSNDAEHLKPQRVRLDNEKSTVPLKYAHHVIVKPISRSQKPSALSPKSINNSAKSSLGIDETYFHGVQRNARDYSSLRTRKSATRISLDTNETIIFRSNSLGRRRDNHPLNYIPSFTTAESKFATLPFSQRPSSPASNYGAYVKLQPDGKIIYSNTVPRIRNSLDKNYSKAEMKTSPKGSSNETKPQTVPACSLSQSVREHQILQPQSDSTSQKCAQEVITYKPMHSLNTERLMDNSSTKIQLGNSSSPAGEKAHLTTENLFALIHSSKKRHNIKTEIDIASPSFQSCLSQCKTNSTTQGGECGFLSSGWPRGRNGSPKYQNGSVIPSPSKSTSIQEFKMLLLQTKNHNLNNSSPSKSAAEQLKATTQFQKQASSNSYSVSSNILQSSSNQSTYVLPSTVPLKRGNRARATLPARQGYPPIWEDHSEESEMDRKCSMQSALIDPMTKSSSEMSATPSWIPPHSSSAWV